MKKFILALIVPFVCLSIGLAQSGSRATVREKKDLFQLISKDVTIFNDIKDGGLKANGLAKKMSVKKINLSRDNEPEYIVVIEDLFLCGAHANCPNWVYRKTGGEYQLLLVTRGETLTLEKTSTNKFRDLRSEGSDSAFEGSGTIFKFDGNIYKASECFTRKYGTKGKKDKIIPLKCEEANQEGN